MSKYCGWCCCFKSDSDAPQKVPVTEEGSEMQMMNARVSPSTGPPEEQLLTRGTNIVQQTVPEEQEHEDELEVNKPKEIERIDSSQVKP